MKIKNVSIVYFSPNGTVRETAKNIGEGFGLPVKEYDLTPFENRWKDYIFSEEDLVVVALPSYGGRLPGICREFFRGIAGNGAFCVPVVVFGNRDYGDALLELNMYCEKKGFKIAASGAFVGQHAMIHDLAAGRPDNEDKNNHLAFSKQVAEKINKLENALELNKLNINGNFPFVSMIMDSPVVPENIKSGAGVINAKVCPVLAIDPDNPDNVDKMRCILCFRCVNMYPEYRDVPESMRPLLIMAKMYSERKQPEIYI